ncbi:N-acetyltransferase [Lysinibacillus sp. 2017]|uniref:GNAT family N-acetyltransferase n=1 Tax=unclassified Lysinibacillus TaxID=2636778 RepID=UPI000D52752C|nr:MULTISPECIES: GNAT family N-acetyltransferase [unclassified Lysinibacillus]AWE07808.1 N-acetyltransferase [Lysinibacillus sp. 2017]TGN34629.1 GNAT family N-acetyltransferase [Lysinibacillus sp. S2017]
MIELRKITGDNIDEVIVLEVGENQKDFIETTNLRSFADAHMLNADGIPATPLAIYADDIMVGFLMYIYDTMDHESFENEVFYGKKSYFIWHNMIDKIYQGKGFGKLAFEKMLADIENMPDGEAEFVTLFYHTSNVIAKTLYASFGFVDTGIIQDNSMLAIKKLDRKITESLCNRLGDAK